MPMLHPCPRCTQALPASAKFCRRCGAAVGAMVNPATVHSARRTTPSSLLTAGLSAMVLVGGVVVAFLFYHVRVPSPAVIPSVQNVGSTGYAAPPVYATPPVVPAYQTPPVSAGPTAVYVVPQGPGQERINRRYPSRIEERETEQDAHRGIGHGH